MTSKIGKWIFIFLYLTFLTSCSNYEHIQDKFYRDSRSEKIFFKSKTVDNFTVYNPVDYNIDFNSMVITDAFIVDKYSVYYFYDTTSGTFISKLDNADRKTFHVLKGEYYAVDKNYVFAARGELVKNADIHSFEPIIDLNIDSGLPLGRDKINIYLYGDVITDISEIDGLNEYITNNPL